MARGGRLLRRMACVTGTVVVASFWVLGAVGRAEAAEDSVRGRFSLFSSWSTISAADGESDDRLELVSRFSVRSSRSDDSGVEFAVDLRAAAYPGEERDARYSVYEAYVGKTLFDGRFHLRLGQMWLYELGGLGSVAGALAEYRSPRVTALGAFRAAVFTGLEREPYDLDFVPDVRKTGAYAVIEGAEGRRHVLGWVQVRNSDITERSVLSMTNFIPIRRVFFLYQAAEYDLNEQAEVGESGLTYVMGNLRLKPIRWLELQANYHRGKSLDARAIADDILAGRPVDPARLEGYLFETLGGRATVISKNVRAWVGLARDTSNRGDAARDRASFGIWARDLLGSGVDLTVTGNSSDAGASSQDWWTVSAGRSFGRSVYLSLEYSSSVAYFRYDGSGTVIENRPESDRVAFSANLYLSRSLSLVLGGERVEDRDRDEMRALAGITYRF